MSNECEDVDDVSVDERRGRRCGLWSAHCALRLVEGHCGRQWRLRGQKGQLLQCDIDTGTQKHTIFVCIVDIGMA